jgi:hypothetical protein
MNATRPRILVLIGVLAAAVTWALLIVVYASLPPLTWTLVPALLIAAGAEAYTGRDLRARIQGRIAARPVAPLFVARMVALAKASSQTAALLAGVSAGFMLYLSGMLDAPTPRSDLVDASLSFAASLVLLAAALYLEYCCRVPRDPRQDADDPPPPRPSPFDHLSVPPLVFRSAARYPFHRSLCFPAYHRALRPPALSLVARPNRRAPQLMTGGGPFGSLGPARLPRFNIAS